MCVCVYANKYIYIYIHICIYIRRSRHTYMSTCSHLYTSIHTAAHQTLWRPIVGRISVTPPKLDVWSVGANLYKVYVFSHICTSIQRGAHQISWRRNVGRISAPHPQGGREERWGDSSLQQKCIFTHIHMHTFRGTPNFMAPECWEDYCTYTPKVDVWSVGAILYNMLTGVNLLSHLEVSL